MFIINQPLVQPLEASKSGLGKYPSNRSKAATRGIIELLAIATQKGIYQPPDIFQHWALSCYRRAWKEIACDEPYEDPPEDLLRTVSIVLHSCILR
jgi:hypothetical protein